MHPLSAGVAVPIFALAATGIPRQPLVTHSGDAIAIDVVGGLLVGKVAGIFGGARLAVRLRLGSLPEDVAWGDVVPVAVLGAIGYTVSLLITRLAFSDVAAEERSAAAVFAASVLASGLAVVLLRRRSRAT